MSVSFRLVWSCMKASLMMLTSPGYDLDDDSLEISVKTCI